MKFTYIENKWTVALHISKGQSYKESWLKKKKKKKESWLRKASQKNTKGIILFLLFSDKIPSESHLCGKIRKES